MQNTNNNLQIISGYGSGNSYLILNVLPKELADIAFETIRDTTEWHEMKHKGGPVPRLVSIQTLSSINTIDSHCQFKEHQEQMLQIDHPIYRHPVDEEPPSSNFTNIIENIRKSAELALRQVLELKEPMEANVVDKNECKTTTTSTTHPSLSLSLYSMNHALVQWYRSGLDYISEHSDKTLDILKNTFISNISLGATRTLILKSKCKRTPDDDCNIHIKKDSPSKYIIQKIKLPHNSMFLLDWKTNLDYTHGIKPDKRLPQDKSKDELLFDANRISITFRNIATYQRSVYNYGLTGANADDSSSSSSSSIGTVLYGQGGFFKTEKDLIRKLQSISSCMHCALLKINSVSERCCVEQERIELLHAFSAENRMISPSNASVNNSNNVTKYQDEELKMFDWEEHYGKGFSICNCNSIINGNT